MYCVDSILKVYSRIHMTEILYSSSIQKSKFIKYTKNTKIQIFSKEYIFCILEYIMYSGIQPRIHREYIKNTF